MVDPGLKTIFTSSTRRKFLTLAGLSIVAVSIYGGPIYGVQSSTNLQTFNFETVTVDVEGKITKRQSHQAKFFSEDLGSGAILEMILVPGGRFDMGSPNTEVGCDRDEWPQHNVNISPFFMSKYKVTQSQWEAVMGNNPSNFKGAQRPIENISWNDAVAFCQKLTQKTGKHYRLSSEAEWEYACRAGTKTPFYFGETIAPNLVNYDGNYPYGSAPKGLDRGQTTDVGIFPPNAFGLYDMHGNLWEWCSDGYHSNYNGAPNDGSSWKTPTDNFRVQRGGCWKNDAVYCRTAIRKWNFAGFHNSYIGFRLALAFP
ncbi:hypothetical protein BCD67_25775 [Oscillatoriales cyanobacterium USR001]|nr:hypothetical protein BCD67_25775 [Oscillatoriales cyanobacterium USR001]